MKLIKLITTILITLSLILAGYLGFKMMTQDNNIHTGITLLLVFSTIAALISFRLTLSSTTKRLYAQVIITILILLGILAMYFDRSLILTLWNYTLGLFILQQGILLLTPYKANSFFLKIVHYIVLSTSLLMILLCVFKIGEGYLFTLLFFGLILMSLGTITRSFIEKH